MPGNIRRGLLCAALLLATVALHGCGQKSAEQPTDRADALLEKVLDAWVRGEKPDKLAATNPAIQVTDPDWSAGYRLQSFLSIDTKPADGTPGSARCRVSLTLTDSKGKKVDKEVEYDVQVGDKSVVTRARAAGSKAK